MIKRTIICTQGIPASGKTTWAKEFVSKNKGWMRVNKDDIRKGMGVDYGPDGNNFDKKKEKLVIDAERNSVHALATSGYNIIVDNTHLIMRKGGKNNHIEFYRTLARELDMNFEVKTFFIREEEAIERDKKRPEGERVGPEVFARMKKYSKFPNEHPDNPTFKPYVEGKWEGVIVDLDGTLAFMDGRRCPYDGSKVIGDRINTHLSSMLSILETAGMDVIFVSGRSNKYRKETQEWLDLHKWGGRPLIMRKEGDVRKDTIVKKEIFEGLIEPKYNIFGVFDDRDCVVSMWRKLNLPTYQVWYGDF